MVETTQVSSAPARPATLLVRDGNGNALRRRATAAPQERSGWSRLQVDFRDIDRLADEVAGYGPDVVAEAPEDLREAVVRRLRGAAGLATETVPAVGGTR